MCLLINHGARVNAKDIHGKTPLHYAAEYQFSSYPLQVLIKNGADVNIKDIHGRTPLHYACKDNITSSSVKHLMKSNANANVVDKDDKTPLELCISDSLYSSAAIVYYTILQAHSYPEMKNDPLFIRNMNTACLYRRCKKLKNLCIKELDTMQSIKLSDAYTLDIFLTSTNKILLNRLSYNVKEEYLDKYLYPIYIQKLEKSVNSAKQDVMLTDKLLQLIYDIDYWCLLPIEIKYKIFSLLDNKDMESVIKSLDENYKGTIINYDYDDYSSCYFDDDKMPPCIIKILDRISLA